MSDPHISESRRRTARADNLPFRVFMWVTIVSALGLIVLFGSHWFRFERHRRISDRMQTAITRLALHRPSDLTDDQWAYCIVWTWNLHGNYGGVPSYVPTDDLERIVEEFETRIDAGPNLTTIDWLWEEYYRAYPRAHNYEKWRPTSPANRPQFEAGDHSGHPLSYWRSEYEQRIGNK